MKTDLFSLLKRKAKGIKNTLLPILGVKTEKRYIGNIGEAAAAKYLRKQGYKIKERNFVAAGAEIDIIAVEKGTVVFMEVKTRSYLPTDNRIGEKEARPAASVTPEKQRKIIAASKFYHKDDLKMHRRFDVLEVYLDKDKKVAQIKHLKNTISMDTAYRT